MKYKLLAGLLVLLMFSGCCTAVTAANHNYSSKKQGKNIYVDQNIGNDDNPGTVKKPLKTIQMAFNKTPENGIIHLTEGTYIVTENTEFKQNNLTIIGANRDRTIISGNNKVIYMHSYHMGSGNTHIGLENLTMTQFSQAMASDNLIIRNCIFLQNEDPLSCNDYAFIDHCLFKENYNSTDKGLIWIPCGRFYTLDQGPSIVNCDFKNNTGTPIEYHGSYLGSVVFVTGCNFINQHGKCLRYIGPIDISYGNSYLGGNYWDGAKTKKEIVEKMEGIDSFHYRFSEVPLDNGYNDY
jgi:hypothetical protein